MICAAPWPKSSNPPPLLPGEVHLWSASLVAGKEQFELYEKFMDMREKARADRYLMDLSRTRFISARAILKQLLSKYTGGDPAEISFRLGPQGKPYLPAKSSPMLQFNSTDTQEEALYAFCLDAEIGVDIEYKTRQVRHEIIAKRKLTKQENDLYLACPESQRKQYFLSLWTRKEAYGKALGVGIKYRLNEVNLVSADSADRVVVRDDEDIQWDVVQVEPAADLIACVVTQGTGWRLRCFRLEPE